MTSPRALAEALTDELLRAQSYPRSAFDAGIDYDRQKRASLIALEEEPGGLRIQSKVKGSEYMPYAQTIHLREGRSGALRIEGACSCAVEVNCKHVVAALLLWRREALVADTGVLPTALGDWLARLERDLHRAGEVYPPEARQRLIYLLAAEERGRLAIRPMAVRLDKNGAATGAPTGYDAQSARLPSPAKFLRAADVSILREISFKRSFNDSGFTYVLDGTEDASLLNQLLETGRAYWMGLDGPVLFRGDPRRAEGRWAGTAGGAQVFRFEIEGDGEAITLAVNPPHYLDPHTGAVGPLQTGLPDLAAVRLIAIPPVPPDALVEVAERLRRAFKPWTEGFAQPADLAETQDLQVAPQPVARLTRIERTPPPGYQGYGIPRPHPADDLPPLSVLQMHFDYGGHRFAEVDMRREVLVRTETGLTRVHRDLKAERRLADRLASTGMRRLQSIQGLHVRHEQRLWFAFGLRSGPEDFIGFMLDERPRLEAAGWIIEADDSFTLDLATPDNDDWDVDLRGPEEGALASGVDWFELDIGVKVDGQQVDLLPSLLYLLRTLASDDPDAALATLAEDRDSGRRLAVKLADGRVLPIPMQRGAALLRALLAIWSVDQLETGKPRVSRFSAGHLAALSEALPSLAFHGGEGLMALARELGRWSERAPTVTPEGFRAVLRPYQQTGLDWLQMLSRTGFGGLLADDMGLGKTVQALAHLAVEKAAGRLPHPVLIVAPTSVLENWRSEAAAFAPGLRVLVLRGMDRHGDFERIGTFDLVLTSYPLLHRDRDVLTAQIWSGVVLDEAQTIRNPGAAWSQAAFALQARMRLALSGTPVENNLGDLWSLMRFLNPGLLGDTKGFTRLYRTPIEKRRDPAARLRLAGRIKPFMLRRTKAQVATDLPEKTEMLDRVELHPEQQKLYDATRLAMDSRVREALQSQGLARSRILILDALLKLRQVCCDPRLVKSAGTRARAGISAKLDRLLALIEELRAEGRSTLVFSQFTSMLSLIRDELEARSIGYVWLTGDTMDRKTPVERFQAGEVDLFLISLKAGGLGLNLTAADTVILYDPWWNPAVEAQAIDRAHRIGQTRPVFIHRLIASATVEEKMLDLQERKRSLAAALWDEDAGSLGSLTEEDVHALFA